MAAKLDRAFSGQVQASAMTIDTVTSAQEKGLSTFQRRRQKRTNRKEQFVPGTTLFTRQCMSM